ncbi:protein arginine N-methyltransferase 1.5-like, partial [Trifolium medium]|nr:protein arginine N-methyltransferase 1.5-like [Trifolium medium]
MTKIGTTQHFASVEHPQTNGQAEAANRVILRGLKRRLDEAKGKWTEELHSVLWTEISIEGELNDEMLREELDLLEELWEGAALREAS